MAVSTPVSAAYEAAQLRGKRDIRVLRILPPVVTDSDTEPIQATLSVLDLDRGCRFATLSYVWGESSDPPKTVTIGDTALAVTDNCHAAIRALRRRYGSLAVWIDAVCINQGDVEEKEHQITLMDDIYARSATTFVWLGASSDATDRAMDLLNHTGLFDCFSMGKRQYDFKFPTPSELRASLAAVFYLHSVVLRPVKLEPGGLEPRPSLAERLRGVLWKAGPKTTTYRDLDQLLAGPWIQRIWTFQEIIFAARPVVVCGDRFVEWSRFAPNVVLHDHLQQLRHATVLSGKQPNVLYFPSLSTWAKVIFMREKIRNANADQADPSKNAPTLQHYQTFVGRIGWIHDLIRAIVLAFCAIMLIPCLIFGIAKYVAAAAVLGSFAFALALLAIVVWLILPLPDNGDRQEENPNLYLMGELSHRLAQREHDIAFGLRSVVGQLLKKELPVPDYSLRCEHVFRDLAVNLLHLTGSAQILVAAALSPLPRGPSWVPDWSMKPSMIWWLWHYFPYKHYAQEEMEWKICPAEPGILRVQGYRTGIVSSVYRFRRTDEAYRPAQSESHLENLRATRRLEAVSITTRNCENEARFFTTLLNSASPDAKISDRDLGKYLYFLFLTSGQDEARVLSLMKPGSSAARIWSVLSPTSTWNHRRVSGLYESSRNCILVFLRNLRRKARLCFLVLRHHPRILPTHARLCNRLAQTDNIAVSQGAGALMGICRGSVEVGQLLVQIKNMPMTFVASSCDDGRIRLVSPLRGLESHPPSAEKREVELDGRFGYGPYRWNRDQPEELCIE